MFKSIKLCKCDASSISLDGGASSCNCLLSEVCASFLQSCWIDTGLHAPLLRRMSQGKQMVLLSRPLKVLMPL